MSNQANQTTGTEDASLSIGDLLPIRGRFKERVWRVDSHWPLKAHTSSQMATIREPDEEGMRTF